MKSYWSYTYGDIVGIGEQHISLYKYSTKSIALVCSHEFGRGFSVNLKKVGGRFNMNLDFGNGPEPGWVFKIDAQENLQKFISSVQKQEVIPRVLNEKTEKQENLILFKKLTELVNLIPEDGEDFILSEGNKIRSYLSFSDDDENAVYTVRSSKKVMHVCQVKT
jgi:hypothetical protein